MATLTISKEDEKRVKAMGFLSNKGTDNFSARIITVNGKITAAQQRCIAGSGGKIRKRSDNLYHPFDGGGTGRSLRQNRRIQGIYCQRRTNHRRNRFCGTPGCSL